MYHPKENVTQADIFWFHSKKEYDGKIWSVSIGHFFKHKPLISKESQRLKIYGKYFM